MMVDQSLLDTALVVKKTVVGMLLNGVVSSESDVSAAGVASGQVCYPLPKLLEYSVNTKNHMRIVRSVLGLVNKNSPVSEDYKDLHDLQTNADIVYNKEGINEVFYTTEKLIKSFILPATVEDVAASIHIMQFNEKQAGLWEVGYMYLMWGKGDLYPDQLHSTNIYPERQTLLRFFFSPVRFTPGLMTDVFPGSQNVHDNTRFESEFIRDGFRHFQYEFDGIALGKKYIEETEHQGFLEEGEFLLKRGNFRFSIVELGKTRINDQDFWIYSGSERIEYLTIDVKCK